MSLNGGKRWGAPAGWAASAPRSQLLSVTHFNWVWTSLLLSLFALLIAFNQIFIRKVTANKMEVKRVNEILHTGLTHTAADRGWVAQLQPAAVCICWKETIKKKRKTFSHGVPWHEDAAMSHILLHRIQKMFKNVPSDSRRGQVYFA